VVSVLVWTICTIMTVSAIALWLLNVLSVDSEWVPVLQGVVGGN